MSMSILNNLCEKAKADTRTPNSRRGGPFIITEMAVGLSVGEGAAVHRLGSVFENGQ